MIFIKFSLIVSQIYFVTDISNDNILTLGNIQIFVYPSKYFDLIWQFGNDDQDDLEECQARGGGIC